MKIEHLAIWAKDIEKIKTFYPDFLSLVQMKHTLILQKNSAPIFFCLQVELELN